MTSSRPSVPQRKIAELSVLLLATLGWTGCNALPAPPSQPPTAMHGGTECEMAMPPQSPTPTLEDEATCEGESTRIEPSDGLGWTEARIWKAHPSRASAGAGLLFVSGVDGGFIEPADNLYSKIAQIYAARGIPSIFVQYRYPGELEPSVQDALAGAEYLRKLGAKRIAIAGWSFGGAVITHSALQIPESVTILGFAPQAKDTEPVSNFTSQSILLFHSDTDENVPFESSQQILDEAPPHLKKEFIPLQGANHLLDGMGDQIFPIVQKWLSQHLLPESRCE